MSYSKTYSLLIIFWLGVLLAACSSEPVVPTFTPTPPTPTKTQTPIPEVSDPEIITDTESVAPVAVPGADLATSAAGFATAVAERTPIPTPIPNVIDRVAEDIVTETGLAEVTFLGLTAEDWVDIVISIILFVLVLLILIPLLSGILNWLVNRTKTQFDNEFLDSIKWELRWLVIVLVGRFDVLRLDFLGEQVETFIQDLSFVLITLLMTLIGLRFVRFSVAWFLQHRVPEENKKRVRPILMAVRWLGYFAIILIATAFVSSHFGVNVTLFTSSFLLIALIIGIIGVAARTAIADVIGGFIILIDQPFRGGDDIFIRDVNTTGEVQSIGLRSTRLLTGDNREVIVPNSIISESQVINYTLPEPTYRVQVDFMVVGQEFEEVQQLIEETVRTVEGVLADKPVDVLYLSFGGTAREIRLRWWVDNFNSQLTVQTKVFMALEKALDEAGIETPNLTYDLNVHRDDE